MNTGGERIAPPPFFVATQGGEPIGSPPFFVARPAASHPPCPGPTGPVDIVG